MDELRKKQKLKKRLYSWPALLVLGFITFIFVRGTVIVFEKKAESAQYVTALQQKADTLRTQETQLESNIAGLKTEAGLEKEVKEKYNVAKDGERVVILVDQKGGSSTDATDTRAWYERAWDAIISAL